MTAAQDGQAERCATCHGILAATCPACHPPVPVPNPDVREAVARWVRGLVALRGGSRLSVEHSAELADELLAVVGQASRADEALVDRFTDRYLDGVGAFDSSNDEQRDRAYVRSGLLELVARPAVVKPAQPDDDGLRQRVEALVSEWATTPHDDPGLQSYTAMRRIQKLLNGTSGDQQDGAR